MAPEKGPFYLKGLTMNEALIITQILEKNGRSFALLIPYGAPFEDLFEILKDFDSKNREKFEEQKKAEEAEKAKKASASDIIPQVTQ